MMCCTRSVFVYEDAGRVDNEDGNLITEQTSGCRFCVRGMCGLLEVCTRTFEQFGLCVLMCR